MIFMGRPEKTVAKGWLSTCSQLDKQPQHMDFIFSVESVLSSLISAAVLLCTDDNAGYDGYDIRLMIDMELFWVLRILTESSGGLQKRGLRTVAERLQSLSAEKTTSLDYINFLEADDRIWLEYPCHA
jgi:hypothetical protein